MVASLLFLSAGLVLRLVQYGANASQWLDEAMLSTGIVGRSLSGLPMNPLAFGQTAPPGLLFVERLSVLAFGQSDLTLRLFPLASALVSLIAFFMICGRAVEGVSRPLAGALVATAAPLITCAAQVKQYSSDVATALLLLLLGLEIQDRGLTRRRAVWAAVAGFCAAWLSQPAVFVIGGVSLVLLWTAWGDRQSERGRASLRLLVPVVSIWAVSALASTVVSWASVPPEIRALLHRYWSHGFMPMPPWRLATLRWPIKELDGLLGSSAIMSLLYPVPQLYVCLMLLGIWALWLRKPRVVVLLFAPTVLTLAAAGAQQYPFSDRLILFLVPCFLLGIAEGIGYAYRLASGFSKAAGAALLVLLTVPLLYPVAASPPPYQVEDMKPVLEYVRSQRLHGDRIYVYNGAMPSFSYYAPRYGFRPEEYTLGHSHQCHTRLYLEELDAFRGNPRLWVIVTHAPYYQERQDILRYLDTKGVRRMQIVASAHKPAGTRPEMLESAEAYLYDMSDQSRNRAVFAATFPVTESPDHQFGCN